MSGKMITRLAVVGLLALVALAAADSVQAQVPEGGALPSGFQSGNNLFLENVGQWPNEDLAFRTVSGGVEVWMTEDGVYYHVAEGPREDLTPGDMEAPDPDDIGYEREGHVVFMQFVRDEGYNLTNMAGLDPQPGEFNWLLGSGNRDKGTYEENFSTGGTGYRGVQYYDVFPGINARFDIAERVHAGAGAVENADEADPAILKVTWEVTPGADPSDIQLQFVGQDGVSIDEYGQVRIETVLGDIVEMQPYAYQMIDGKLDRVAAWFEADGATVGFHVAGYDADETLYIDPLVLFSGEIIGGQYYEYLAESQEDASGYYFTGQTYDPYYNFPTTPGAYQTTSNYSYQWFASKMSPDWQNLIYSTYIGHRYTNYVGNSALASDGSLYIAGSPYYGYSYGWPYTYLYGTTYSSSRYDCGVFHLSADGSSRISAALFAGVSTQYDYCGDVEIGPNGDIYVTGSTNAYYESGQFPEAGGGGYDLDNYSSYDGFIIRLGPGLDDYYNSGNFTYVGNGSSSDGVSGVAFDSSGNVYATGMGYGDFYDSDYDIGPGGSYQAYAAKFSADLTSRYWLTEYGGSSQEGPYFGYTSNAYYLGYNSCITVDGQNRAWIAGGTRSTDFPVTAGAYQTSSGGSLDAYVLAMMANGSDIEYATYLGGGGYDMGKVVKIGQDDDVYFAGWGSSGFPTTPGEVQESNAGGYDFVRSILTPDLSDLICSTFYGGSSTDYGIDMELHPTTPYRAVVAGSGWAPSFPDFGNVVLYGPGGYYDVAVVDLNCGGAALILENENFYSIPMTHQLDCITAGDLIVYEFDVTNQGLSEQPDNSGPEVEGMFTGPQVYYDCIVDSGVCSGAGNGFMWNGTIPSGGTVHFEVQGRVKGGTPAFTELCIAGALHFDPGSGINEITEEFEICTETNCPPTVDPNKQLGKQVHLPILNFQGMDDVCRTWIEVQNIGPEFNKAILVTWGEPGFCPPQCAGPLKVECSGLLKPGSTWNFMGAQVPTGSKSGMLFQFSAKQLLDVGVDLGFDDVVADLMCETLFFGVVGDCDDYRRFKKAYNEEGSFAGIPMNDRVKGHGILAVDVLRHCPGDVTPGVEVSSKYNGIASDHLGMFDETFGGYAYYAPLLYADKAGFNSVMYIQNGGLECSSIEIWFKAQDDCLRARICEIFTLAPGESYQYDATDCVGPDWQGSAWLRSTQPLGIVVDIIGRDVLMTYVGEPAQLNYTFDPEQAVFTPGNQVAYGPLVYSEYQGWDSGIQVQNLSSVTAAKVKVYFLDRSGDVITTLIDWICPRGSQTYFLPVVHNLPGNWVGSVRVESQEWWTPGDPLVLPPWIVGVATLIKYNDAARGEAQEAIAYNLLPEHKAYDWQIGFGGGGTDSGIGLIAIPSMLKDLDATGLTTEIAVTNLVPKPGFTDFVIFIYDQNGLLDYVCEKLNEKQVEYINLQTWGFINPGFKGSGFISAMFWEHDVFDDTGFFLRNLVGLAAVSIERTGTPLGEDVPGDEAAGSRGIPFRLSDVEDMEFEFDFEGHSNPLCPGVPVFRPKPGECNLDDYDQTWIFEMTGGNVRQYTLLEDPAGTCFNTGVSRNWEDNPFLFTPCGAFELTATCTAQDLSLGTACGTGVPMMNALLYQPPNDSGNECESLLDSSVNTTAGTGVGLMMNQPYTFSDPSGSPLTLPGELEYQVHGHTVCDSFPPSSTGTVTVDFDFDG